MSKKLWIGLAAVAIVAVVAVNLIKNGATKPIAHVLPVVKIGYRAQDLYAPLFVGMEKGYFKKQGFNVEPVKFESTNDLTSALLAGQVDASLGGVNTFLLLNIEQKSPGALKLFGTAEETKHKPSSFLIVKKNGPITSLESLKGKKIGAGPGSTMQMIYRIMMTQNNITTSTLVQMDQKLELPALAAGQIDAAIVLEPLATIGAEKNITRNLESGLFDAYILPNLPVAASVVTIKFVTAHPDVVQKLMVATDEAVDFIQHNPDELKTILTKFTPVELELAKKIITPPFQKSTEINVERLQQLTDKLLVEKELRGRVEVAGMVLK